MSRKFTLIPQVCKGNWLLHFVPIWGTILPSMGGLSRLIDLIIEFWDNLKPWTVIDAFEHAVVLRLGGGKALSPGGRPYHRVLRPGFHWMIPFLDVSIPFRSVPQGGSFDPVVVVSKDGTPYLCQFHILHRIEDIVVFVVDVEDADAVLLDAIAGTIRKIISGLTDEELRDEGLEQKLTERARARAKRFGIYVERVYVSELAPMGLKSGVLRVGLDHKHQ